MSTVFILFVGLIEMLRIPMHKENPRRLNLIFIGENEEVGIRFRRSFANRMV